MKQKKFLLAIWLLFGQLFISNTVLDANSLEDDNLAATESDLSQIDERINMQTSEVVNVIVEFKGGVGNRVSETRSGMTIEKSHNQFARFVNTLRRQRTNAYDTNKIAITHEYHYAYAGVAMQLPGTAVNLLVESPVVERIWLDATYTLSTDRKMETYQMRSNEFINVSQVHAEGFSGQGVRVGVIDTGIDYNHPDLTSSYHGYRFEEGVDPTSSIQKKR